MWRALSALGKCLKIVACPCYVVHQELCYDSPIPQLVNRDPRLPLLRWLYQPVCCRRGCGEIPPSKALSEEYGITDFSGRNIRLKIAVEDVVERLVDDPGGTRVERCLD